jgi:hydroxypyruvate isomerase
MKIKRKESRREFLKVAGLSGAVLASGAVTSLLAGSQSLIKKPAPAQPTSPKPGSFNLKYAPPFGMFEALAGKDPLDQMKFIADQGFRAIFDNGLPGRPPAQQEAIASLAAKLGLEIGPFVAYADFSVESFVLKDESVREMLKGKIKTALETSKRTGVKLALMVPGRYNQRMDWDYQTTNVIENLKWCAGICEPAGLVIVLEPLNPKDHPGNIEACWDEIAAFHLGDTPGRKEPGTGELNFKNIFKFIHGKGYNGVLCMEHGKSQPGREGELAVIQAYREADSF